MHSTGTGFVATTAFVLLLSASCGTKEEPAKAMDAAASATPPPPPPACDAGQHVDPSGRCAPDSDAAPAEPAPSATASAAPPPGKCPDLANAERVYGFDWVKGFGAEAALATTLKGVSGAAAESMALSQEVDGELRIACLNLAQALGSKGPFASTVATCQAAADAIRTTRGKLGPKAKVAVHAHQPVCAAPVPADCAEACSGSAGHSACDGNATPVGTCAEICDGTCEYWTGGKCDGNCQGKCDATFSGTCNGMCVGTCGGKTVSGPCQGTCEGTCDGDVRGACKGVCRGACQGPVRGCPGLCVGKCSSGMKDPRCQAMVKVDGATAECSAYCATRAVRKAACSTPAVTVVVTNADDGAPTKLYVQAIEHNLPLVLKVQRRLAGRVDAIGKNQAVVSKGLAAITASKSAAVPALGACLFGVERGVTEGIERMNGAFRSAGLVAGVAESK